MKYLEHRTVQDERWDALAWRYYQNPHAYERLQRANPQVPRSAVLPVGIVLRIPVDDVPEAKVWPGLPPWLR